MLLKYCLYTVLISLSICYWYDRYLLLQSVYWIFCYKVYIKVRILFYELYCIGYRNGMDKWVYIWNFNDI